MPKNTDRMMDIEPWLIDEMRIPRGRFNPWPDFDVEYPDVLWIGNLVK
jgi:hypothetical protein